MSRMLHWLSVAAFELCAIILWMAGITLFMLAIGAIIITIGG